MDDLVITPDLTVPGAELELRFARSGGPGGQHVNTSATKVEVRWNVAESAALNEAQRTRLLTTLASRLDADGLLRIVAEDTRSQLKNRALALGRLQTVVATALKPRRTRRPTRPTAGSREARLAAKKHRGAIKGERQRRFEGE
jgi:ribosome-associated protein